MLLEALNEKIIDSAIRDIKGSSLSTSFVPLLLQPGTQVYPKHATRSFELKNELDSYLHIRSHTNITRDQKGDESQHR